LASYKIRAEKSFIISTARDYNMEYHEVEKIYDLYYKPNCYKEFYDRLEEFIKHRSTMS